MVIYFSYKLICIYSIAVLTLKIKIGKWYQTLKMYGDRSGYFRRSSPKLLLIISSNNERETWVAEYTVLKDSCTDLFGD